MTKEDRFFIEPLVHGLGGSVFIVSERLTDATYLGLRVVRGERPGEELRVGRHLIGDFSPLPDQNPAANYNARLVLTSRCAVTVDRFIEPLARPIGK